MSGSVNKAIILGNLGQDPDVRNSNNGTMIVNLSVATSESWKDRKSGEKRENTTWHRVTIFGGLDNDGLAGVASKYLKKGSKVYLEGQIQTRKWTDKDGVDRYTTEIVLKGFSAQLVLLDRQEGSGRPPPPNGEDDYGKPKSRPGKGGESSAFDSGAADDDIPF